MLENITPLSFKPYGRVIKSPFSVAAQKGGQFLTKTKDIENGRFNKLYFHPGKKTILDIYDGIAILYVGFSKNDLKMFLLDKTVEINEGVFYCACPLVKKATIMTAYAEGTQNTLIAALEKPQYIMPAVQPKEIYTFFYHEKERGFVFKGEKHEFWELTYVDRGELVNVVDGQKYRLTQGKIMFFAPGQFHSQHAESNDNVCYVTVSFRMSNVDESLFKNIIFTSDGEIKALVKKMLTEKESDRIFSEDLLLCYLKEIIINLARAHRLEKVVEKAFAPVKQNIESDIVKAAKAYVDENISKRFNIPRIAESIPISGSYLSVLFKKNTGMTLNDYIIERKMEVAKEYIRKGRYTFTQISSLVGYNNVHYFSTCFKKHYGITPTDYANSIKQ